MSLHLIRLISSQSAEGALSLNSNQTLHLPSGVPSRGQSIDISLMIRVFDLDITALFVRL